MHVFLGRCRAPPSTPFVEVRTCPRYHAVDQYRLTHKPSADKQAQLLVVSKMSAVKSWCFEVSSDTVSVGIHDLKCNN